MKWVRRVQTAARGVCRAQVESVVRARALSRIVAGGVLVFVITWLLSPDAEPSAPTALELGAGSSVLQAAAQDLAASSPELRRRTGGSEMDVLLKDTTANAVLRREEQSAAVDMSVLSPENHETLTAVEVAARAVLSHNLERALAQFAGGDAPDPDQHAPPPIDGPPVKIPTSHDALAKLAVILYASPEQKNCRSSSSYLCSHIYYLRCILLGGAAHMTLAYSVEDIRFSSTTASSSGGRMSGAGQNSDSAEAEHCVVLLLVNSKADIETVVQVLTEFRQKTPAETSSASLKNVPIGVLHVPLDNATAQDERDVASALRGTQVVQEELDFVLSAATGQALAQDHEYGSLRVLRVSRGSRTPAQCLPEWTSELHLEPDHMYCHCMYHVRRASARSLRFTFFHMTEFAEGQSKLRSIALREKMLELATSFQDEDSEGDQEEDVTELSDSRGGLQIDQLQRVRVRHKPGVVLSSEQLLESSVVGDVGCDRRLGAIQSHLDEIVLDAKTYESASTIEESEARDSKHSAMSILARSNRSPAQSCAPRNINARAGFCEAGCRSDPKYPYFAMLQHSSFVVIGCVATLIQQRALEQRIWDALMMSAIPVRVSCDDDLYLGSEVLSDLHHTLDPASAQDALNVIEPKNAEALRKLLLAFAAESRSSMEEKLESWNVVQRKLARAFRAVIEKLATDVAVFMRERIAYRAS
uniref:Uncharacterized protein n=1 Tax=Erythrolobus australicus TaxID=1077150 RepID=A0A7S1TNC6_9RHOD|mmetsp:Transcript_4953/g.13327  ORF Transcript_4953/g.13327 Transcript_4953/m.13327 type:complete len:701 (+) Transcript_4953:27-2129(+)